jgi:hypothetical protein
MPIWKSNLASLQRGAVSSAGRGVLKVRNLKVVDSESPHATADVAPAASPRPVGTYSLSLPSSIPSPSPSPSNRRSASRASSSPRRCHGAHCGHHWHRDLGWHCHYHFQCQRQASGVIVFVLAWADPSSRRSAKGTVALTGPRGHSVQPEGTKRAASCQGQVSSGSGQVSSYYLAEV